jgi:sterol desaturase/sphingolipid hydroxylase (fatty acid hydroxylase superfamily)
MMDTLSAAVQYMLFPIVYLTYPNSQFYVLTYITSALLAFVVLKLLRRTGPVAAGKNKYWFLPERAYENVHARLDFKLFLVNVYYILLQALITGGATFLTVPLVIKICTLLFGPASAAAAPSIPLTAICMLLVFLAHELGYWFGHLLLHKVPALWEFHKVHHSAEQLTPLTELRQHPLEAMLGPFFMVSLASLVQGPLVYAYGAQSIVLDPAAQNIITLIFYYTIIHWRHTDLPIYLPGIWARLIQAPTHHQVHHSTDPKHFDKNLGYCLSIFDWAFGTLYVPKKEENITYGIGDHDEAYASVASNLIVPIKRAVALIAKGEAFSFKK